MMSALKKIELLFCSIRNEYNFNFDYDDKRYLRAIRRERRLNRIEQNLKK